MSRARKVLSVVALALVLAVGAGWYLQDRLLLALIGFAVQRRVPVGPNVPITWDRGVDPHGRAPGERPPNIVVIVADDLGWNDLSWNGGGVAGGSVPTPSIDSLARDGVTFTAGYSANGTCAPSRAALLSGRYGTRFGFEFTPTPAGMSTIVPRLWNGMPGRLRPMIRHDGAAGDFDAQGMPASELTLAELLKTAGYHTVHIGKWHLGGTHGMAAHQQGFDESLLLASMLYLPVDDPNVVNAKQDFDPIDRFLWRAGKHAASFNGGPAFAPAGYLTDYYADEAVKAIEANEDRPFFLYLAHWAPHTPLQAWRADYDALAHVPDHRMRVYAAMIRALDRGVGRVLEALRAHGLEDDTLVFFTSDNGAPGYIGLPDVNRPFRGWKITFFEGGIHVPYFVRWPARVPRGRRYDAPVHGFDVFATAAAAAGVPLPADRKIDGVDLVPFARGEGEGVPHRELFWRTGHYRVALVDGWKLHVSERPPGTAFLFDLRNDPTEQRDLAAREPERVAALRRAIAAHDADQVASAWPSLTESPINVDKTLAEPDAPDDVYVYWPN
ncbi:MAG TPA: sulfatase-like hydrolase/transferase [Myxococcota bacterium]|nr:sulfatase-like hydrolase/transferase [Myxococcota bacterium]